MTEWRRVSRVDGGKRWTDHERGRFKIARGYGARWEPQWSLHVDGRWVSDHKTLHAAKAAAEATERAA